jgi:putative alpha-1,2-mannosidase
MKSEYKDAPGGLAGNDDAGQMSAWYVLSALGLYQVCPGVPEYWTGSPSFDDIRVHLPNGRVLHIVATGAESGKRYVNRISINGHRVNDWKVSYTQIMNGGELRYEMSSVPSGPVVKD